MAASKLTGLPIPSEDKDPWYDDYVEFVNQVDNQFYGLLSSACHIIVPPTLVDWHAGTGRFSWNDDFRIPILGSGFILNVKFGPDGINRYADLNDGDKLIVTIPITSAGNTVANFQVVSGKVNWANGLFVFGMRMGNNFYANIPTVFTP
jgi:hypothetical protein